jgi:hypothetical protein
MRLKTRIVREAMDTVRGVTGDSASFDLYKRVTDYMLPDRRDQFFFLPDRSSGSIDGLEGIIHNQLSHD